MILIDELGNEVVMDIIFTFSSDETGRSYVLYFNPEAEQQEIYASIFSEDGQLSQIEDPTEWAMVEEVYAGFMDQQEGCECGGGCGCHGDDEEQYQIIKDRIAKDGVRYIAYEPNMTEEMINIFNRLVLELGLTRIDLHHLSFLTQSDLDNNGDYITIMYENLANLKLVE